MKFQELFRQGMKRSMPELLEFDGIALDIGATGRAVVHGATPLGLPDWVFPLNRIPYDNATVSTIYAYHFLEHLSGNEAIYFLREAERVMIPGHSVMNFCIPYYSSNLQAQDLTHKSCWSEHTFKTLFDNPWYDPAGTWELRVHTIMIAGIVERNLALIGQLVR